MDVDKGTRSWDLKLVIILIAVLSVVTDMAGFLRFTPSLGLPAWTAVLCVVPTKFVEWKFLAFSARLWRRGWPGRVQSPVYIFIWCLAVALSALAAHATIFNALAAADRTAATKVETRANLVGSLNRINAQLDAFGKLLPRPAKTVEQALGWAASVPTVTRNCMRSFQEAARDDVCKTVIELRKELAAARDYERLMQEAEALRSKLAGLNIEAALDPMPQAFEATVGRVVHLEGKNGIALMGMLMLGLVSAFGFFGLDTLRGSLPAPALPQAADSLGTAMGAAQEARRQGGQVIQFQSAHRGQGACPPSPASSRAVRPVGGEAPAQFNRQTARRARETVREASARAGTSSAQGRADQTTAMAAIRAFVGMLEKGADARARGSELANAYADRRARHGWPALPFNVIGMHLKTAVEELGGRKFKSGGQVYEGVCLPAAWREPQAQTA